MNPRNRVRDDLLSRGWSVWESHATPNALVGIHRGELRMIHINEPGEFTATVTANGITYNFDPGPVLEKRAKHETA